jgi:hypothetical protein
MTLGCAEARGRLCVGPIRLLAGDRRLRGGSASVTRRRPPVTRRQCVGYAAATAGCAPDTFRLRNRRPPGRNFPMVLDTYTIFGGEMGGVREKS